MKISIRALLFTVVATALVPVAAHAQTPPASAQPKTPFSVADFAKLRWLEGAWEGTSPGEATIYARYHVANDSSIDITYYSDPELSHQTGSGRVYLSVGRVYHTFGPGRWGATHLDSDGIFLIPQVQARNTFQWTPKTADSWTATSRSGVSGHDRVTVYEMKRLKRP